MGPPGALFKEWMRAARNAPLICGWLSIAIGTVICFGWITGTGFLAGAFLGAPGAPVASAALIASLGAVALCLRPGAERLAPAGRALAWIVGLAATVFLLNEVGKGLDIHWAEDGAWSRPSISILLSTIIFAVGFLTIDLDPPRHRWFIALQPVLGILTLAMLLSQGFQPHAIIDPEVAQEVSYGSACGLILIYISYLCLRPDRGLIGFLLSQGPGPSMARYLVPTAIVLPLLIGGAEAVTARIGEAEGIVGKGAGEILVLIILLAVIAFSSQRLQRYYHHWRDSVSAMAERADVLRGMSEGVGVVRISDSRFVLTNPQFDAMHGFEKGGLIGKHVNVTTPGDLSPDEVRAWNGVAEELTSTGSANFNSRVVRRDGDQIWCRSNVVLSEHPVHGAVMILVKSDITDEHEALEAKQNAEFRFRQVFEQSPIGLCLVRPDGSFENVNAAFETITGYSTGELSEMTFADITFPDDLELDLRLSGAMFNGETDGFEMEKRYIRKDGETVWIYLTATMLRDSDGRSQKALSMVEDITERHELSRQLQHLADHDPLTGLYNRRRFEDELGKAVGQADPDRAGLAILNIDLDNFKFINDTYGHSVGDRLIVRTAEMLSERLRGTDTLARQGGDEFVIVLRDIDRDGALRIARELADLVAGEVRVDGPEYSARVTASIGVAYADPGLDVSEESLMIQADIAMYEVKDSGRNGAKLYDPDRGSDIGQSLDWVERIRTALANDDFALYAQPIFRFEDDGIPHHELFIRMRANDGSLIPPGAFLPIAERHDLIQEIDQWVICRAIQTLAECQGRGARARLCVNLSGRSVGDPRLLEVISNELDRSGADPSGLIFEVTETSAIGNIASAQSFARSLAGLGCRFALDDFGTGFASFYYLKHIACDYVKIDGEFVRHLAIDPTNRLLVRALVDISRGMGKLTIAEQVEDAETLELLREYGVDFVQGYHVGRPRPIEEIDLDSSPGPPPPAPGPVS